LIYIIIGVIFLILALILLLILFIPFHISLYLKKRGKDSGGYFQVKWLSIRLLKRDIPWEEEEKEEEEKKERKRSIDDIIDVLKKLMDAFKYLTPIFRAFLKSLELEKLSLNLNFRILQSGNHRPSLRLFMEYNTVIKSPTPDKSLCNS
jgi:hypothetical protein